MTDVFLLLQLPNAGDELQAAKKGVIELADLILVNKADLDPPAAARAVGQMESALHMRSRPVGAVWAPRVLPMSAVRAADVEQVWRVIEEFRAMQVASGALIARRRGQARAWLWERVDAGLRDAFRARPGVQTVLAATLAAVDEGSVPATVAARRLLDAFAGVVDTPPVP